jgi:class 3 adenylate cyclase
MGLALHVPRIRYASTPDGASIAHLVFGKGDVPLLVLLSMPSHLEAMWDLPNVAREVERYAAFCRVVMLDYRGTGLSDPLPEDGYDLRAFVRDIEAVLDAASIERTAVYGEVFSGPLAIALAALAPTRVANLIVRETFATPLSSDQHPFGIPPAEVDTRLAENRTHWGEGVTLSGWVPQDEDALLLQDWARFERMAASPARADLWFRTVVYANVATLLSAVQAPTLIMQAADSLLAPPASGQYLAEHIRGARLIDGPTAVSLSTGTGIDQLVAQVADFLVGSPMAASVDHELTVVMFSDIVNSTAHAAAVGDRTWRDELEEFRRIVRRHLDRYQGKEVATRGDDFLATFTHPTAAVNCATALREALQPLPFAVRTGIHLGEVERHNGDVNGVTVHIGARTTALAQAHEIMVTSTVKEAMIGSGVGFSLRGSHHLRGVPGTWNTYLVDP